MHVVALAGGYGTRLGALTKDTPKALLDINGRPLLDYTLSRLLKMSDVTQITLVSNDKFYDQILAWSVTAPSPIPINVLNDKTTSNENRLELLGDLWFAINNLDINEDILLVGADNFFTFDLSPVVLRARETGSSTAGCYDVGDVALAKRYGVASVDADGKITSIAEKPGQPASTLALMMLWYIQKDDLQLVQDLIDENGKGIVGENFIDHLSKKSSVYAVTFDKPFYDIGSVEEYNKVNSLFRQSM